MKLVAMLRVKNAKLTINQCLTKLSQLCDEIVIVDNGSTDGTQNLYKKFPKIVKIAHTKGFHEGRDKIIALNLAKSRKPEWILWIDADEIFEEIVTREKLEKYMRNSKINLVKFRMFNFWLSKTHYRVDGIWKRYTAQPQRAMWRNMKSVYFRNLKFHNGGIQGVQGKLKTSYLRLKHYGYFSLVQLKVRTRIYGKLQGESMSNKTLLTDKNEKVTLRKFKSGCFNSIIDFIYWNGVEKLYNLNQFIKSRK